MYEDQKSWKDLLQQSGLPLEQSVKRVLEELGSRRPSELKFERTQRDGSKTTSSVDVVGLLTSTNEIDVNFTVECKHRRDGIRWVFAPAEKQFWSKPSIDLVANIRHELHAVVPEPRASHLLVPNKSVSKGIEMFKGKDSFSADITTALFQLRYGVAQQFYDYLWDYDPFRNVSAFVPILVTTAQLWRLGDGVGYETVRNASNMEDVAEQCDSLLVCEFPDVSIRRDLVHFLMEGISDTALGEMESLLLQITNISLKDLLKRLSEFPRFFYVVNYAHFDSLCRQILEVIQGMRMVSKSRDEDQ